MGKREGRKGKAEKGKGSEGDRKGETSWGCVGETKRKGHERRGKEPKRR